MNHLVVFSFLWRFVENKEKKIGGRDSISLVSRRSLWFLTNSLFLCVVHDLKALKFSSLELFFNRKSEKKKKKKLLPSRCGSHVIVNKAFFNTQTEGIL